MLRSKKQPFKKQSSNNYYFKYVMKKTIIFLSLTVVFSLETSFFAQSDSDQTLTLEAQVIKYSNNDCKGELELFVSGGVAPYMYSIDAGKTFHSSKIFQNLCEGSYFIQSKDALGKYGLTMVQLIQNYVPDLFSEEEQKAIRESYIKELLLTRARVLDQWELLREVDFQLSKYGQRYAPIITSQVSNETTISYIFKVLKMNSYQKETMMMLYERQIYIFKDHLLDLKYDHENGTTQVSFKIDTPKEVLNEFFKLNGFTGFN